ncbi:hypothetical protein QA641_17950 [Bradyrhizobium sp. CB1650]|uniref:hypothetical protein n=1 Tax=Bradyrhizobium sp. CB1650 TaxID=3039153 RepID=UPI002435F755|nr:hypothetical protein [Bradyrhizobium sp. CB1650]WGD55591.1 hypothetical protein QA641_17950 [Bradyrhizobium sp. CB1650]
MDAVRALRPDIPWTSIIVGIVGGEIPVYAANGFGRDWRYAAAVDRDRLIAAVGTRRPSPGEGVGPDRWLTATSRPRYYRRDHGLGHGTGWHAVDQLIVGSRRKVDRETATKAAKNRLQAKAIIEAMIANRQHGDLASAFMEAWNRGDHWVAAIKTSLATYDDDFRNFLRGELGKGITGLGADPADYGLGDDPENTTAETPSSAGPKWEGGNGTKRRRISHERSAAVAKNESRSMS